MLPSVLHKTEHEPAIRRVAQAVHLNSNTTSSLSSTPLHRERLSGASLALSSFRFVSHESRPRRIAIVTTGRITGDWCFVPAVAERAGGGPTVQCHPDGFCSAFYRVGPRLDDDHLLFCTARPVVHLPTARRCVWPCAGLTMMVRMMVRLVV